MQTHTALAARRRGSTDGEPLPPDVPVLACRGLDVWLGGHQILHQIDLTVPSSQTVALLGGNGSGKTTLVRALLRLIPHQAGTAELFGQDQSAFHDWRRIGYVPQRGQMHADNATVQEVVSCGRLARRRWFTPAATADTQAVNQALERVGISQFGHRQLGTLSGGQQQRALIARALASHADLLIMDEPFAALDVATQASLAELFARLQGEGLSILTVLHDLGPMEPLINRAIVLQNGRVIHDGPLTQGPPTDSGHHHYPETDEVLMRGLEWGPQSDGQE